MIKPGTLCFVVNCTGKTFKENVDKLVVIQHHIGYHTFPGGRVWDTYQCKSEGTPLMTTGGLKMSAKVPAMNLRPIRGLDEKTGEEQKDKELTV